MSTAENPLIHWNLTGSESRIRRILDVAPFHSLPEVNHDALRAYYLRLLRRMSFPFKAEHIELTGPERHVIVLRLVDPAQHTSTLDSGLLCEARQEDRLVQVPLAELKVDADDRNYQLIEDYWYWFWNWHK